MKGGFVKTTTHDNYCSTFNCHIKPYFEGFMLADVKAMHLQDYINEKVKVISSNTVRKHIILIGTVMKDAVNNDLIPHNPVDRIKKPQKIKPQQNRYTPDELRELLLVTRGTELEAPVFIAAVFGLRRGEIIGLRWQDIDFINKTLTVNGSVTRNNIDGKWRDVYDDTLKTEASHGKYILNDYVCEYFRHLYKHNQSLISNVDDYKDFVCVNAVGERLKLDFVTQKFSKILKENGLRKIRFHDLRHSVLDYLAKHFDPKAVQGFARHANFQTTFDIYCQTDENDTRSELDCVCAALGFGGASSQGLQENLQEKVQETCRKTFSEDSVSDG
ncbi:MAG: site-specific integrase [Muribaculaceae bacterium]|nr:site-specific integrase [Muribaculaceae bacterium]